MREVQVVEVGVYYRYTDFARKAQQDGGCDGVGRGLKPRQQGSFTLGCQPCVAEDLAIDRQPAPPGQRGGHQLAHRAADPPAGRG